LGREKNIQRFKHTEPEIRKGMTAPLPPTRTATIERCAQYRSGPKIARGGRRKSVWSEGKKKGAGKRPLPNLRKSLEDLGEKSVAFRRKKKAHRAVETQRVGGQEGPCNRLVPWDSRPTRRERGKGKKVPGPRTSRGRINTSARLRMNALQTKLSGRGAEKASS